MPGKPKTVAGVSSKTAYGGGPAVGALGPSTAPLRMVIDVVQPEAEELHDMGPADGAHGRQPVCALPLRVLEALFGLGPWRRRRVLGQQLLGDRRPVCHPIPPC